MKLRARTLNFRCGILGYYHKWFIKAFGNELDEVDKLVKRVYNDVFTGFDVGKIDTNKLDKIIAKPWASDGKHFSTRIWDKKNEMLNSLHMELTRNVLLGKAPDDAIKSMIKHVDKNIKNAKFCAGRLVMTEQAYFHSEAQKDVFSDLEVEEYEIVAVIDSVTSPICREMNGKHFKTSEMQISLNAPPFHCFCRSTTVPYFDDKTTNYVISELNKLKTSGIPDDDYTQYIRMINNHSNIDIKNLYSKYADEISEVKFIMSEDAFYEPSSNSLTFNFDKHANINKYGILAHEYGHFFDAQVPFDNVHFKEIEAIRNITGLNSIFNTVASSSDEFLEAIRKDKEHIKGIITHEDKVDLIKNDTSYAVQGMIDGLFTKSRINWGHGERYYNRKYASIAYLDKIAGTSRKKELQKLYNGMGLDASNQAKVKNICRQYETASETWANIMSAEIVGGEELEYIKKYLPNSYRALLEILKGVK